MAGGDRSFTAVHDSTMHTVPQPLILQAPLSHPEQPGPSYLPLKTAHVPQLKTAAQRTGILPEGAPHCRHCCHSRRCAACPPSKL